jgi:dephospho-CoA kinase
LKTMVIGLTGLIASGKTETGRVFKEAGFTVIDVDSFAHGLYKKGKPLYHGLVKKYGKVILARGGQINRRELAKLAFAGKKQYLTFNHIVFPYLNKALYSALRTSHSALTVLDMAVLFESGFYRRCDAVVFVKAPEKQIRARLNARKTGPAGKALIYQKLFKVNKKIALSDFILYNDKNKAALTRAARKLISKIKEKHERS